MKNSRARLLLPLVLALAALGCIHNFQILAAPEIKNPVIDWASNPALPFRAGYAREQITPPMNVWMAGYDFLRRSHGVHDDLYARVLVLEQGDDKLALVSLDLVGLNRPDVEKIKARVPGFRPDQIVIACTHVHDGPDTMGLWGLPPLYSGQNQRYMMLLTLHVVEAIGRARAAVRPVTVEDAVYQMAPDLTYNQNAPEPKDDTMGLMVFRGAHGVVATLVNFACHPEVMQKDNHLISSDFVGVMCREVEKRYGGGCLFFTGALGSLISPRVDTPHDRRTFADVEEMGRRAAAEVDRGMALLTPEEQPYLLRKMSLIRVPVDNRIYVVLKDSGMIDREVYPGPSFITEVNLIEIGRAQFVTFPGEAYPKQGLNIRRHQKPLSFQIALADDELGYILYPDDYASELYKYEAGLCPGPQLAVEIEKALLALLAQ